MKNILILLLFVIYFHSFGQYEYGTVNISENNAINLERDTAILNNLLKLDLHKYIGKTVSYFIANDTIKDYKDYTSSSIPPFKILDINFTFAKDLVVVAQIKYNQNNKVKFATIRNYSNDTIINIFIKKTGFEKLIANEIANRNNIEIYLLETIKTDTLNQCKYCFIPAIQDLCDTAFIKNSDIIGYDTTENKHALILSKKCLNNLNQITSGTDFPIRIPFALAINGKPIYGGWLTNRNNTNSQSIDWVYITIPINSDKANYIETGNIDAENDPRNNKLLLESFFYSSRLVKK